jgi:class 3 adenylate cyclase
MISPQTRYAKSGDIKIAYQVIGNGSRDLIFVPGWVSNIEVFWEEPAVTSALIMANSFAGLKPAPGYQGRPRVALEQFIEVCERDWGGPVGIDGYAPSMAKDERFRQWWARFLRMSATATAAIALLRMNYEIDARDVLSVIRVPTLIFHGARDMIVPISASRYVADRIAGAKSIELPSSDHLPFFGNADTILDETEEFVTGIRRGPEPDRVLATVLFTDIVGSTEKAAQLGDRRWRDLLEAHHALIRRELARYRGREIDTTGDGFFATFDGPARGVRCACSIVEAVRSLAIEVRAGLHTGECDVAEDDMSGIAVHIGARVAALAAPREVLVSRTVKDLVAGSGLRFQDRGIQSLKGVPGDWHLFAVEH